VLLQRMMGLAAAMLLSACATQYQSVGLTGGHYESKGPGRLEMVSFSANGYTSAALAQKYALYRCAEVAQAKNKPFFIMYDSLSGAARDLPAQQPRVGWVQNKPVATAFLLLLDAPRRGVHETGTTLEELHDIIVTGKLDGKADSPAPTSSKT